MSEEKSINVRELTQKVRYYWSELWRKKWWIIFISALVSGLFVFDAWRTPKTYPAKLTFMVNNQEGNSGGLGALLGEIGFGSNKNGPNYQKISEIGLSRKILSQVLLQKTRFKNNLDYTGNHLIREYKLHETWENDTILQSFLFTDSTSDDLRFNRMSDVAIELLSRKLRGYPELNRPGIVRIKYNDESTILRVECVTNSENFSILLANTVYENLSDFYIQQSIESQRRTYEHVKAKNDSIFKVIQLTEYELANFRDQGQGIILNRFQLPKIQMQRKLEMLYTLYGESVKNLETADFILKNSTPYFQVIDEPQGPIYPEGKSRLIAMIKGGFGGVLIGIILILARRWFLDELNNSKTEERSVAV